MKKLFKKILFLVVAIIIIIAIYSIRACMPFRGINKECDTENGGYKVEINGYDIWYNIYNEESELSPVYVIAGGTGLSSDYLEDSLMFIAESRPVIFYDGRCQGRSEYKSDLKNCDFENYAEDLEALRKYLTPEDDIILLCHSYGGATALQYAVDYQENVEAMIFLSSVGVKTKLMASDAYFRTGFPPLNQEKANQWYVDNMAEIYRNYIADESVKNLFEDTKINYALYMKNDALDKYDFTDELTDCKIPALIFVGGEKETPITDKNVAEELSQTFVNSEMHVFSECGHFLFYEQHDEFCELTDDFLSNLE
jgi:proline iminopeptidase